MRNKQPLILRTDLASGIDVIVLTYATTTGMTSSSRFTAQPFFSAPISHLLHPYRSHKHHGIPPRITAATKYSIIYSVALNYCIQCQSQKQVLASTMPS